MVYIERVGIDSMQKTVKHTENYVGTFPQNAHVAQCQNCHYDNSDLLKRIRIVEGRGDKWNFDEESQELAQEWYQRKNMEYVPSKKVTCENGCKVVYESFWICKKCCELEDEGYDGDYESWAYSTEKAQTPLGESEVIHTEILN